MKKIVLFALLSIVMALPPLAVGSNQASTPATTEKVTLNWWTWTLPTEEDFVVLKEGFEAKYPNIELVYSVNQMDD